MDTIQKNPIGRPTEWTLEKVMIEAEELLKYGEKEPIPFFKEFAYKRGYTANHFTLWAKKYPEFQEAYIKYKHLQETKIAKGGLTNKFNSFLTHSYLKNVCGWRDKQEIEHSGEASIIINRPKQTE